MNSSGIKRGLAATAVAALAVTGLPFLASSASATPLTDQAAALTLVSPSANSVPLSAKADGTNSTVRLEAIAPAAITSVTFQYSLNGTDFTDIGTAFSDNGAFAYEWNPSSIAGATGVTIRAVSGAATSSRTGVAINNTFDTVNVTDGDAIGVFQSPYGGGEDWVALSGTKSDTSVANADRALISFWNGAAFSAGAPATSAVAQGASTGTWSSVLNIDGYPFGANDQLLVKATEANDATEDTEAFNLYKQTITTVTATAASTNIPAGDETKVTVKVLDQNGAPIANARVNNSDSSDTAFTDGNGVATFDQGPGSDFYFADATNAPGYNSELGDKRSDAVTVTQYNAVPTSLSASSVDGAAFDIDEYGANDITVQAKDQTGANIDVSNEQDLRYTWTFTPSGGGTPVVVPASPATGEVTDEVDAAPGTDNTGKFVVPLDSSNTAGLQTESGTYVLNASLEANAGGNNAIAASNLLTVKVGDSTLSWTTGDPAQAKAGTDLTATGKLVLEDGTPLAGRNVTVTYNLGGNAGIVQANGSVAGSRTVQTAADGTFSVVLRDPAASPQPEETTGNLSAVTASGTSDSDNPTEGPVVLQVDFINDVTPATVAFTADNTAPTGTVDLNGGGAHTPGELQEYDIEVRTADDPNTAGDQSKPLTNSTVTVKVDHGYFTDGTPATAPAIGADAGAYKDLGKSVEVKTDGSGVATVLVGIGRDEGFDDDGKVTATITATAGTATKTQTQDWNSADPINGGQVKIVASPEDRQSGPIDPAPLSGSIRYDVFTTDQFGNVVGNEPVAITVDDPDATVSGLTAGSVNSDFDNRGEIVVTADRAGTYQITGSWTTETYRFTVATGNGTPTRVAPAGETVTGTADAEFYAVDFAASDITISSSPEGNVPVGTAVTETVKVVDQEGNPVPGLSVRFVVNGPGSQSSDSANTITTNANGEAFYTVVGNSAGTANVTAIVSDGTQVKNLSDSITFEAPAEEPTDISDTTISSDAEGPVTPGTIVTETVKVLDQNGDPVKGVSVEFFRSGPAGATDTKTVTTNAAGEAIYTFTSTDEGTATIRATASDDDQNITVTDEVVFDDGVTPPAPIVARLTGADNGARADRLTVTTAPAATGATVKLYTVKNGVRKLVKTGTLNADGSISFRVKDMNKNRFTKYVAVVSATDTTLGDTTNAKRVR